MTLQFPKSKYEHKNNILLDEFYEKICDLENHLLKEESITEIENLAQLYKIGVENFSMKDPKRSEIFLKSLHSLLIKYSHVFENENYKKKTEVNYSKRLNKVLKVELISNYYNKSGSNYSELNNQVLSLIKEFEMRMNNVIKIVNDDMISQERKFFRNKMKKKNAIELMMAVVSTKYKGLYINYYIEINTNHEKLNVYGN